MPLSNHFRPIIVTGLVLAFLSSGCCSRHKPKAKPPTRSTVVVRVQPTGGKAKELRARLRLSYVERAAPIERLGATALLYVYPRSRVLGVDLTTAAAPADVALIDEHMKVLRVATRTRARVTAAPRLHRYALVLPGDTAAGLGLAPGARVSFDLPSRARAARTLTPVRLSPAGRKSVLVMCELALSEPERTEGLMWRRSLPPRGGMLFRFPDEQVLSFWMKNTLIPLDMIFINNDFVVTGVVHDAKPRTETPRHVGRVRNRYVLEVPSGFARKHGVARGTGVSFSLP